MNARIPRTRTPQDATVIQMAMTDVPCRQKWDATAAITAHAITAATRSLKLPALLVIVRSFRRQDHGFGARHLVRRDVRESGFHQHVA
jgi:hypothetical protein